MSIVTAIITTHKRNPEIVERALKSVIAQTYHVEDVIIVDDSPSDFEHRMDVKKMVKGYADRNVKYIEHTQCQGACAARNTGIAASRGEFVAFLDDDDEWKPEKIEKQLEKFKDDKIALVYCGAEVFNDADGSVNYDKTDYLRGKVYENLILNNFIGSTSYPLIRKKALIDVGGFDVLMQSAQDYELWLRISQKYEVDYVPEALALYHVHPGVRISTNPAKRINGLERLNSKNIDFIKNNRITRYYRYIKITPFYSANKQMAKALRVWLYCVCLRPLNIRENIRYFKSIISQ